MPECTPEERRLLDALNGNPDVNIYELRAELAISRVPEGLIESVIAARAMAMRGAQMEKKAWDALETFGVPGKYSSQSKAFDSFYSRVDAEARKRAGE